MRSSNHLLAIRQANHYYLFGVPLEGRNWNSSAYRFTGINGQETDPELGVGVSTAMFWEYDAKLGRRWNLDPVTKSFQGNYTAFRDNPMLYIDPNGDDDFFNSKGQFMGRTGTGNAIRVVDDGVTLNAAILTIPNTTKLLTEFYYCPEDLSNRSMISAIATFYAPEAILSEKILHGESKEGAYFYRSTTDHIYVASNPETGLVSNANENFNDLINSLVHEKEHRTNVDTRKELHHTDAILIQVNHSSFAKTSQRFKVSAVWYAAKILNNAITIEGATTEQIQEQIDKVNASKLSDTGFLYLNEDNKVDYVLSVDEVKVIGTQDSTDKPKTNADKANTDKK